MDSLFEKYGGFETIQKIVIAFYREILARETLAPYFATINLEHLIDHQTRFLSHLLGGPASYHGKTLRAAHIHSKITDAAFDEVATILEFVLEDAGVTQEDINTIMTVVSGARTDVVSEVNDTNAS